MPAPKTKRDRKRLVALPAPKTFHLDKRADQILADGAGEDDELLDTRAQAEWLGVSVQWLEIARVRGDGPPFLKLAPRIVRYPRGGTRRWLRARMYRSTSEYA